MKIKALYKTPIYENHLVLQTVDGEYMRFYDKPARRITENDLTPVPFYRAEGRAGEEAPEYVYAMYGLETKDYNSMCLRCPHLETVCDGTESKLWSGCVLRDVDADEARAYIKTMSGLAEKARQNSKNP